MGTRLGVVSFLNTKPLVHAFETGAIDHGFDLFYDVPSVCAEKLHVHDTDVALIPTIEIARAPEPYAIVRGVALGSRGPVDSVLLLLNKEPKDVESVAMDTSSRTSVALSRILLEKRYGAKPTTFRRAPDPDAMLEEADAALIIGDRALELDKPAYTAIDLGGAWQEMTGLPFVYACWTGRLGTLSREECDILREAKAYGLARLPEIGAAFAKGRPFPAEFYEAYLRDSMWFDMDEPELEGMRRFFAYAAELELIDAAPELTFFHDR